jgi:hypothetical protein
MMAEAHRISTNKTWRSLGYEWHNYIQLRCIGSHDNANNQTQKIHIARRQNPVPQASDLEQHITNHGRVPRSQRLDDRGRDNRSPRATQAVLEIANHAQAQGDWRIRQTIESAGAWDEFLVAQDLSSDDPLFQSLVPVVTGLIPEGVEVESMLSQCEI